MRRRKQKAPAIGRGFFIKECAYVAGLSVIATDNAIFAVRYFQKERLAPLLAFPIRVSFVMLNSAFT